MRLGEAITSIRRDGLSPTAYRRITVVALALLGIIVVTGAAVRLTGSGLGCNDWPRCNDQELIDVGSKHAAIEQINRLFTGLVSVAVILAVLGALIRRPRRRDLTWLSLGLVAGVIAQIVLGGITVLVDLHPLAVQSHLLLSMVLVADAVVLVVRAGQPDEGRRIAAVVPRTKQRVRWVVVWTGLAIVAGTVVTGTGPHAGDEEARRFDLAITTVTRIHGVVVWIAVAAMLWLVWHLRGLAHDREVLDAPLVRVGSCRHRPGDDRLPAVLEWRPRRVGGAARRRGDDALGDHGVAGVQHDAACRRPPTSCCATSRRPGLAPSADVSAARRVSRHGPGRRLQ